MRIIRHIDHLPAEARGSAVAVGNFDGVHRGHEAVIREAGALAKAAGVPWSVLTFEPHPRSVFRPDDPPFRLTPFRAKARLIEALGVDELFVLSFDKAFSQRSAEDFVNSVLVDGLDAGHVVAGYDFVFGHGRKGNCETLLQMGQQKGFDFTAVHAVLDEAGEVFSSTRVRDALSGGNPKLATRLLGRPFEVEGHVAHGDQRGGGIGFPTANLPLDDYTQPKFGVYAVRVGLLDAKDAGKLTWHDGAANLGVRPTVGCDGPLLEAHLFDFDGNLYGKHIRVQLLDYLRPEKKFDGLDALKAQIAADCGLARERLTEFYAS